MGLQIKLGLFKRGDIRKVEQVLGLSFAHCPTEFAKITRPWIEIPS